MYRINGRFWNNADRYENSKGSFKDPQRPPDGTQNISEIYITARKNFYRLWFSQNNWISHLMPHFLHSWSVFRLKCSNLIASNFTHNICAFVWFTGICKNEFVIYMSFSGYDIGLVELWKDSFHNDKNYWCIHQTMQGLEEY